MEHVVAFLPNMQLLLLANLRHYWLYLSTKSYTRILKRTRSGDSADELFSANAKIEFASSVFLSVSLSLQVFMDSRLKEERRYKVDTRYRKELLIGLQCLK